LIDRGIDAMGHRSLGDLIQSLFCPRGFDPRGIDPRGIDTRDIDPTGH